MKLILQFILFLFIISLTSPTVVVLIKKNTDFTLSFDVEEKEEICKELMEIKTDYKHSFEISNVLFIEVKKSIIIFENFSKHKTSLKEILSPPPELV